MADRKHSDKRNNGSKPIGSFGGNIVMTAGTGAVTIMDGGEILAAGDTYPDETPKKTFNQ